MGLLLVILVCLVARVAFLALIPASAVSVDLRAWLKVASELASGANPYVSTTVLNWPPLWVQIVFSLDHVSQFLSIPLYRVIQAFLIGVELVLVVVLFRVLHRGVVKGSPVRLAMLGIALNPVCILQVCQHGNFDVLVGLWVIAAVLMLLRFHDARQGVDWLFACLFVGLGILTKTTPIVLLPVLLTGFRLVDIRARVLGLMLVFCPVALGVSVLYALDPIATTRNVLLYRSVPGCFGFSGLLSMWNAQSLLTACTKLFAPLLVAGLVGFSVMMAWRPPKQRDGTFLIGMAALWLMIIPALGPGYAPQYIYWFLPLLVILAGTAAGAMRPASRVFLVVAAVTYVVEYALNPVLGAFLVPMTTSESVVRAALAFQTPAVQTVIRLPLFAAYLALVAVLLVRVVRGETSAAPSSRSS